VWGFDRLIVDVQRDGVIGPFSPLCLVLRHAPLRGWSLSEESLTGGDVAKRPGQLSPRGLPKPHGPTREPAKINGGAGKGKAASMNQRTPTTSVLGSTVAVRAVSGEDTVTMQNRVL
jgi:hypothetical protein